MRSGKNDNETGYGKPPKKNRFRKGRSGNPKGRPKGSKNFSAYLDTVLHSPVTVIEKGQKKTVSAQEAALLRLREQAVKGDMRPLLEFLQLARQRSAELEGQSAERKLAETEDGILERYGQDLLAQAGMLNDTLNKEDDEDEK